MSKSDLHNKLLEKLVTKMYKCSLPTTIQGIALLFARYMTKSQEEMIRFLNHVVVANTKNGLKVVMDRWLLHQPRFIGKLTKNATYLALMRMFASKDKVLNELLVLGYDPSHTKDSPEVYAPLKILSTLLRCYDNEKRSEGKDMRVDPRLTRIGRRYGRQVPPADGRRGKVRNV